MSVALNNERAERMTNSRTEHYRLQAQSRIQLALCKKKFLSSLLKLSPNQPVYVYREKEKRWTGSYLTRI